MKEELIKILKNNITLTCHAGETRMVVNFQDIADIIHNYVTQEGLTEVITPINLRGIRSKSEQSFNEDCDLDDIKESYPEKDYEKEIYMEAYWRGYIEGYQDTTGLNLPLP